MTITLTVLATGIPLFSVLGAACNWAIFVRRLRSSMVCLVALPLSLIGCALHPFLPWYAGFLAVPLDPGVFLCGFDLSPITLARVHRTGAQLGVTFYADGDAPEMGQAPSGRADRQH